MGEILCEIPKGNLMVYQLTLPELFAKLKEEKSDLVIVVLGAGCLRENPNTVEFKCIYS